MRAVEPSPSGLRHVEDTESRGRLGAQHDVLERAEDRNEREVLQQLSAYQPIGRMGTSEEVAHLALYLCSDEASFVTGQAYPIDGGVLVS